MVFYDNIDNHLTYLQILILLFILLLIMVANDADTSASKVGEETEKMIASPDTEVTGRRKGMSEYTRKTLIGVVIVILLAFSWVGAQQFAQSAVRLHTFSAPYFTTWFSTCWMTLCFPAYVLFIACAEWNKEAFYAHVKESRNLFGQHPVTLLEFFKIIWVLNVIWLSVNYLYIFGLKFVAATVASSIMVSNVAFVYILSLFILNERLCVIRVVATTLCIGGVVLFGYAEGFQGSADMLKGVIMVIVSAFGAAIYKVVFKRVIGAGALGQVSLFLSLLGLSNLLIMWIVNVPLHLTGWESFSFDDIPWEVLVCSASLSLLFNFMVNFGIAYTYPLFISIAMMIGVPLNAGVDVLFRGESFNTIRLISAVLIFAGFGIMLLPDSWNDPIHNFFGCKTEKQDENNDQGNLELEERPLTKNDSAGTGGT